MYRVPADGYKYMRTCIGLRGHPLAKQRPGTITWYRQEETSGVVEGQLCDSERVAVKLADLSPRATIPQDDERVLGLGSLARSRSRQSRSV